MKKWTITFLIITLSIGFITFQLHTFAQDASLSEWNEGVDGYVKGIRLQKNNSKPVAAFFYTDWCTNCKRLREDILATPEFREFAKNHLITVKINPESGLLENQLAEEFGVFGYPSFFIIPADSSKTQSIKKTSHISTEDFIQQVKNAIKS